jgi:hypothetical protein
MLFAIGLVRSEPDKYVTDGIDTLIHVYNQTVIGKAK